MSTIRCACVINPVEPSPLSFRAPMGIETFVDIDFYAQGSPPKLYSVGLGGQLQLTGRSTAQTQAFSLIATDVANGKTRAVLPADTIQDPFGYQLRVFGTVNNQMQLIAAGTVMPIAAVTPEVIAPDVIDNLPITMQRQVDTAIQVDIWADDSKSVEYDLANTSIVANVWTDASESISLAPFTTTVIDNNTVILSMDGDIIDSFPDACWWSLRAFFGTGVTTLAHGDVAVVGLAPAPIPPLVTLTTDFDYQMPNTGTPTDGQIIHQGYVRDTLLISTKDAGGNDITPTLVALRPGHYIYSGTVVWTVIGTVGATGWYEVTVSPLTQLAAAGTASFTFSDSAPVAPVGPVIDTTWFAGTNTVTPVTVIGGKAHCQRNGIDDPRISKRITNLEEGRSYRIDTSHTLVTAGLTSYYRVDNDPQLPSGTYGSFATGAPGPVTLTFTAPVGGTVWFGLVVDTLNDGESADTDDIFNLTGL